MLIAVILFNLAAAYALAHANLNPSAALIPAYDSEDIPNHTLMTAIPHPPAKRAPSPTPTKTPHIICIPPLSDRLTPSFRGCKPVLDKLRRFENYRLYQAFKMGHSPKPPHTPPIDIEEEGSDCFLRINCAFPDVVDWFTFEQVRQVALDIIEECRDTGGAGGGGDLGHVVGWSVAVGGVKRRDGGGEGDGGVGGG